MTLVWDYLCRGILFFFASLTKYTDVLLWAPGVEKRHFGVQARCLIFSDLDLTLFYHNRRYSRSHSVLLSWVYWPFKAEAFRFLYFLEVKSLLFKVKNLGYG